MKKNILFLAMLSLTAVACSDLDSLVSDAPTPDSEKEPISFSMSDGSEGMTRAGFTGDATFIAMRIQSDHTTNSGTRYTCTTATAFKNPSTATEAYSTIGFDNDQKRYWDDAYGRYSMLSVFAVAIPNISTDVKRLATKMGGVSKTWKSPASAHTIAWEVETNQDATTVKQGDLAYSNNIKSGGTDGRYVWHKTAGKYLPDPTGNTNHYDGQMQFLQLVDDPGIIDTPSGIIGKFDKGHLVFNHALSRITVKLSLSAGFDASDENNFKLSDAGVQFLGMKVKGTLDLPNGSWTLDTSAPTGTITTKPTRQTVATPITSVYYETTIQVLPGYTFTDGSTTNVIQFIIDNNTYYITQDMLYDALKAGAMSSATGTSITMEQGKNYKFSFNVKKRQIDNMTATLIPWGDVAAQEKDLSNARIKLQLEERGNAQTSNVKFYKAADNNTGEFNDNYTTWNWKTGYTQLNGASYSSDHWTTNEYWQSSKDFYHFRAVMPASTTITTDGSGDGDYVVLTSASSYTDVCWGAPMLDDGDNTTNGSFKWLYGPTQGGFDTDDANKVATGLPTDTQHQIYQAIGPTDDPIKLILFHMMSELTFNIKTTSGSEAVTLVDGDKKTNVKIVGAYPGGKVLLGTGLVSTTGSTSDQEVAWNSESPSGTHVYKFGAVPQLLTSVLLYITTPDNNQYIVELKDVKATSVTNNNIANPYNKVGGDGADKDKYTIDRWYPGFKYTYTFTLKKTGITNLQATVLNWETVEADNDDIQIK